MSDRFQKVEKRFQELEHLLSDQQIISDKSQYQKLAKELSDITPFVALYRDFKKAADQAPEF